MDKEGRRVTTASSFQIRLRLCHISSCHDSFEFHWSFRSSHTCFCCTFSLEPTATSSREEA